MEKTTDRIKRYLQDIAEIQTLKNRQLGMVQERVTMMRECDKPPALVYLETIEDCIRLIHLYDDRMARRRVWIGEELKKLDS